VSTGYLISVVSCWIRLWESDVVFLSFKKESASSTFYQHVRTFKEQISTGTILWYHYLNGIGDALMDPTNKRPLSYSDFVLRLTGDEHFRLYLHQLFQFLHEAGEGKVTDRIEVTLGGISEIMTFLEKNEAVPLVGDRRQPN